MNLWSPKLKIEHTLIVQPAAELNVNPKILTLNVRPNNSERKQIRKWDITQRSYCAAGTQFLDFRHLIIMLKKRTLLSAQCLSNLRGETFMSSWVFQHYWPLKSNYQVNNEPQTSLWVSVHYSNIFILSDRRIYTTSIDCGEFERVVESWRSVDMDL